ncbi:MAG: glycosyltransferase family 2 protein [Candidatus Kapaibacterium sp.]|nr:glycosyltransferase family 2 protein [Candidatus Kapabacteria bacterium]
MNPIQILPEYFIVLLPIIFGCLTIFLVTATINIMFGPFLYKAKELDSREKISVLVPARNEERNIEILIKSILNQKYPNYELIVLDDNSSDNTYDIAAKYIDNPKFKLLRGTNLPNGWLGKNYACQCLADAATGEYLIFTDADNYHDINALSKTVSMMKRYNLDMLSAFPQQKTISFYEKLIIPLIDVIIYSGLILWTTYHLKSSAFAAANGQWIAFRKKLYQEIGGHAAVKDKIVEDVELSRIAKKSKAKIMTASGKDLIFGRMYNSLNEIWEGLSKNIYGLTNFETIPFFVLTLLIFLACILPYFMLLSKTLFEFALVAVLINSVWRFLLAVRYSHNIFISVFLHPISMILLILIGFNSFYRSTFKTLRWKGRDIKIK